MVQPKPVRALPDLAPSNPFLTKEQREEEEVKVEAKRRALDKLLEREGLATYKIEILFGSGFSTVRPTHGIISFWESGTKFDGGGDTIMHICPGKELKGNGCDAFIHDTSHGYGFLVCPKCGEAWNGDQVYGQIGFRLGIKDWARVVLRFYQKLDMKADIYVKYHPSDIRSAAAQEQARQHMGEVLLKARRSRRPRIYPLKNIIKDTSAGADILTRFEAFLRA